VGNSSIVYGLASWRKASNLKYLGNTLFLFEKYIISPIYLLCILRIAYDWWIYSYPSGYCHCCGTHSNYPGAKAAVGIWVIDDRVGCDQPNQTKSSGTRKNHQQKGKQNRCDATQYHPPFALDFLLFLFGSDQANPVESPDRYVPLSRFRRRGPHLQRS